jgi:hypothetical protein
VGAEDVSMPTPTYAEAEERLRRLLAENDLPMPDEVVHRPAEVVFLYHGQKLAVVFEIDGPPHE